MWLYQYDTDYGVFFRVEIAALRVEFVAVDWESLEAAEYCKADTVSPR